mmetsp:Transcript_40905/g.93255  ORF Transcript_40905/g.93255 Transcript_40905/m.93255 type:complete len:201 (+) Transcript_40905:508-1110(+)
MVGHVDAGRPAVVVEDLLRAGDDLDHVLDDPRLLVDADALLRDGGGLAVLGDRGAVGGDVLLDHLGAVVFHTRLVVPDRPQDGRRPVDVHGGLEVHGIATLRRCPTLLLPHLGVELSVDPRRRVELAAALDNARVVKPHLQHLHRRLHPRKPRVPEEHPVRAEPVARDPLCARRGRLQTLHPPLGDAKVLPHVRRALLDL